MSQRCLGCMELFGDEFRVCPHCGYVIGTAAEEAIHIEPGTLLYDRYIVGKVLGYGGFGVTYLGWDGKLEQKVAIKEYLPGEFSTRMPGQSRITVFNGEKNDQFHDGLKKFVEEAKRLAKFQNEAGIVKIFDSFEENDTAYIVMEYLEGETLKDYLKRVGTVAEDKAIAMLMPVMNSLQTVHKQGLLHRDIAPDNIFITSDGQVKLIDFGASRYATTSHSRSLTVIIKPGYSPEEQYRSRGDQGPYTDVYAIAATMYKMMTGKTPPDAMERRAKYESQNKDILVEPHKLNRKISRNRENAILNAMNVRIEDRTPDTETFIKQLNSVKPVKRVYGKIKKIDLYSWPLWIKVLIPILLALLLAFGALLFTGVIQFSKFTEEIVIPNGMVTVPEVEGLYKDDALKELSDSNLLVETKASESEYVSAGTIALQSPIGGRTVPKNTSIVLTVSSGTGVIMPIDGKSTVPYVIWQDKENALAMLNEAGLGTPTIEEAYDDSVSVGQVISQSIEANTVVDEGTSIKIIISLGPKSFAMPDVRGMNYEQAEQQLVAKGLTVTFDYAKNNTVDEDCVVSQTVEPGTEVKRGGEVKLVISSGKTTVALPGVEGMLKDTAKKMLESSGFVVNIYEEYDTTVKSGYIIRQYPSGNTSQLYGTTVTVYVSKGKQPVQVSFNANGGSVSTTQMTGYYSDTYGSLPTPTKSGYTFTGWYTAASGGSKITSSTTITSTSAHTLYAHWSLKTYTLSFNANGGSVSESYREIAAGENYGTLPTPTRKNYTFVGWYTSLSGGSQVYQSTKMGSYDTTIYAHWLADTSRLYFDANGGSVSESVREIQIGEKYGYLPEPTRNDYTFIGWFTSRSGGSYVSSNTTMGSSDTTIYAHWEESKHTLYFDANGGSVSESSRSVSSGKSYGSLPTPTRSGYTFAGWYTSRSGGSYVTSTTTMGSYDTTIYAHWEESTHTLYFNANGGYVSETSRSVNSGANYGTLPTPTRDNYTFDGWYTSASGGSYVSSSNKMGDYDTTIYAQWTKKSESDWVTKDQIPSGATITQTGTQYRYQDKETTTSSSSSMSGWTQYDENTVTGDWGSWSSWSDWSTNSASYSYTDTKEVQCETKTQYRYYRYYCSKNSSHGWYAGANCKHWMTTNGVNCSGYCYMSNLAYIWLDTSFSTASSWTIATEDTQVRKIAEDGVYWYYYPNNGWGHHTTRTVYRTRYRTRNINTTYSFYRWGDWSSWSWNEVNSSSTRNVETRTVYKYIPK